MRIYSLKAATYLQGSSGSDCSNKRSTQNKTNLTSPNTSPVISKLPKVVLMRLKNLAVSEEVWICNLPFIIIQVSTTFSNQDSQLHVTPPIKLALSSRRYSRMAVKESKTSLASILAAASFSEFSPPGAGHKNLILLMKKFANLTD